MLKKTITIILILVVSFLSASQLELKEESDIFENIKPTDILKGTVVHIFKEIRGAHAIPQKIAKVKLHSEPINQELSLIEINDDRVAIGDQIIVAKMESTATFGMADVFEYTLKYVSIARDHLILYLILPIFLILLIINKKSWSIATTFAINIFLIMIFLPFIVIKYNIPCITFVILFFIVNSFLFKKIFKSRNYDTALMASIPTALGTGLLYHFFVKAAKLNEYSLASKEVLLPTIQNIPSLNITSIVIASFFLYMFSSLFFINITYKKNLYDNFSTAVWKISLLYMFLILGLNLQTILFFQHNGLGILHLFNYLPFTQFLTKIIFLYWGNILCCTLYLGFFYTKHKTYFQKHLHIKENQTIPLPIDLTEIISNKKEKKYNDQAKQKDNTKKKKKTNRKKPQKNNITRKNAKKVKRNKK